MNLQIMDWRLVYVLISLASVTAEQNVKNLNIALSTVTNNANNAEAILQEAIRDFRLRAASVASHNATNTLGDESNDGGEMNLIVRANEGAKFEFMPHFERDLYEFMVPEGVSQADSIMAIIDFFGVPGVEAPHFKIVADALRLFDIGTIDVMQSANYVRYRIPIMQRAGANVDAVQIPRHIYIFKIMAMQNRHVSEANIKAEVLTSTRKLMASEMRENQESSITTSLGDENSVRTDVVTVAPVINSIADGADITFTMEADAADLAVNGGSLATRSVTEDNASSEPIKIELVGSPQPLATKSVSSPKAAETEFATTAQAVEKTQEIGNDASVSTEIDTSSLLEAAVNGDSEAITILDGAINGASIPKEFFDEMALVDSLLTHDVDNDTNNTDLTIISNKKTLSQNFEASNNSQLATTQSVESPQAFQTTQPFIHTDTEIDSSFVHEAIKPPVHETQESQTPRELASEQPNNQPVDTFIDPLSVTFDADTDESVTSNDEFIQDQAPQDFSSLGVEIQLRGTLNATISVPQHAMPMDELNGINAVIVQRSDVKNVDEVFELQINPPGIFDVRPHYALAGQRVAIIIVEPSVFQQGQETEENTERTTKHLRFTLECTYAKHELRAQLPSGLIASRSFVADGEPATRRGGSLQFSKSHYEFLVDENATKGAFVGQLALLNGGKNATSTSQIELRGESSKNFHIDDNGKITLMCAGNCLDAESLDILNLVAVATTTDDAAAVPITIRVNDVNDNAPVLRTFDTEAHVVDDELLNPFFVIVSDADVSAENRHNSLELDGSAAEFLTAERLSDALWQVKVSAFASSGVYTLVLKARDATNRTDAEDTVQITIIVKGESAKIRFSKSVYERTILSERLNKGNPLIQLELKGTSSNSISFVILDGNPGWLAIESYGGHVYVGDVPRHNIKSGSYSATVGAVEQDTRKILAKCQLLITVVGAPQNVFVLHKPFYSVLVAKNSAETLRKFALADTLGAAKNAALKIIDGSVRAYDKNAKRVIEPLGFVLQLDDYNDVLVKDSRHDALAEIQQLFFQIQNADNERDKTLIGISLSSQAQDVFERLHNVSRPRFSAPWIDESTPIKRNRTLYGFIGLYTLRMPEEFPQNHVVLRLPAHNPLSGLAIANYTLTGAGAHFFNIDSTTATIHIQERIDYESLSAEEQRAITFEVHAFNALEDTVFEKLASYRDDVSTVAHVEVQVFDVDDTPPTINLTSGTRRVFVAESARAGETLATFTANDPDSRKLKYYLTGGSPEALDNFRIEQRGDEHSITIAPDARLDRETTDRYALVVTCVDPAGNKDQLELEVVVRDENDNRPLFTKASAETSVVQVYDNWPAGVVLAHFEAHDKDIGDNARIVYSLTVDQHFSQDYFEIDNVTGVLRTARPLAGLASERPYAISLIATDAGTPRFSSSTRVNVIVRDASQSSDFDDATLRFVTPTPHFVLELPEDTPIGRKIFTMEALVGANARKAPGAITYSIEAHGGTENAEAVSWLRVDPTTGDVFTAAPLDYEIRRFISWNSNRYFAMITLEDRFDLMLDRVRNRLTASMQRPKRSASMNMLNAGDGAEAERSAPMPTPKRAPAKLAAEYLDGYDFRKFGYSTRRSAVAQAAAAFDKKKRGTSLRTRRSMRRRFNTTSSQTRPLPAIARPLAAIPHNIVYVEELNDDYHDNYQVDESSNTKHTSEGLDVEQEVFHDDAHERAVDDYGENGDIFARQLDQNWNFDNFSHEVEKNDTIETSEEKEELSWSTDLRILEKSLLESIKKRTAAATAHMRQMRGSTPALYADDDHTVTEDLNSTSTRPDSILIAKNKLYTNRRITEKEPRHVMYGALPLKSDNDVMSTYLSLQNVNHALDVSASGNVPSTMYNVGDATPMLMRKTRNRYGGYVPPELETGNRDSIGLDEINVVRKQSDDVLTVINIPNTTLESGYSSNGTTTALPASSSPSPPPPILETARISDTFESKISSLKAKLHDAKQAEQAERVTQELKARFAAMNMTSEDKIPEKTQKKSRKSLSSLNLFKIFSHVPKVNIASDNMAKKQQKSQNSSRGLVISPRLKRRTHKSSKMVEPTTALNGSAAKSLQSLPTTERDIEDDNAAIVPTGHHEVAIPWWQCSADNYHRFYDNSAYSDRLACASNQRLYRFSSATALSSVDASEAAIKFLQKRIKETKYITAVFESTGNGIGPILPDITGEFRHWLGPRSRLLAVACEVHWSVPEAYRSRAVEIKMKDCLHRALRDNNCRVLNLYDECRRGLPASFIESKTEESCARDATVDAFQGIYRRYYPDLLALQDPRTIVSHKSYWTLEALSGERRRPLTPAPARFLQRSLANIQLARKSIVAINMATLRLDDDVTNYDVERDERHDILI